LETGVNFLNSGLNNEIVKKELATGVEVNINNSGLNDESVIDIDTIESEGNLGLGQRCIIRDYGPTLTCFIF
jgi:hypothetical protein